MIDRCEELFVSSPCVHSYGVLFPIHGRRKKRKSSLFLLGFSQPFVVLQCDTNSTRLHFDTFFCPLRSSFTSLRIITCVLHYFL